MWVAMPRSSTRQSRQLAGTSSIRVSAQHAQPRQRECASERRRESARPLSIAQAPECVPQWVECSVVILQLKWVRNCGVRMSRVQRMNTSCHGEQMIDKAASAAHPSMAMIDTAATVTSTSTTLGVYIAPALRTPATSCKIVHQHRTERNLQVITTFDLQVTSYKSRGMPGRVRQIKTNSTYELVRVAIRSRSCIDNVQS